MKLFEDEAKKILRENGIKAPKGISGCNLEDIMKFKESIGKDLVLKPQGIKGRGKAGVIKFASSPADIQRFASEVIGKKINGERIQEILAEEKVDIEKELYVAVVIDFGAGVPVMIISSEGGVDIEQTVKECPEKVERIEIDITKGIDRESVKSSARKLGIGDQEGFADVAYKVYAIFRKTDAEIVEVNPLATSREGEFIAIDALIAVNDDSTFRQPDIGKMPNPECNGYEKIMKDMGWSYIDMDGDIGVICSGAGLSMATLDLVHQFGGRTANFLDMAQVDGNGIYKAFEMLSGKENVKAIFLNLFAGLNCCESMAKGAKEFLMNNHIHIPIVARMVGNNEEGGSRILKEAGIENFSELEDAVQAVVKIGNGHSG